MVNFDKHISHPSLLIRMFLYCQILQSRKKMPRTKSSIRIDDNNALIFRFFKSDVNCTILIEKMIKSKIKSKTIIRRNNICFSGRKIIRGSKNLFTEISFVLVDGKTFVVITQKIFKEISNIICFSGRKIVNVA